MFYKSRSVFATIYGIGRANDPPYLLSMRYPVSAAIVFFGFFGILQASDNGPNAVLFRGVRYEMAGSPAVIAQDFVDIRATGANALLAGLVAHDSLIVLADSIDLTLFQQLPLRNLPAETLEEQADSLLAEVTRIGHMAAVHPSVRYLGIAEKVDTSDERACSVLSKLAEAADHASGNRLRLFYTPAFIEDDLCHSVVDFVLIDNKGEERIDVHPARWRRIHETPIGLTGLGTWVDDSLPQGHRVPHSPAYQARLIEHQLNAAFTGKVGRLKAVFVDRWRDVVDDVPDLTGDVTRPYLRASGLHARTGEARPALDVVRGIYTGEQTVFAFLAGEEVMEGGNAGFRWLVLILVGIVALIVRSTPNVRDLGRRYFRAHGIYLENISFGRNIDTGPHLLGFLLLALSAGVTMNILFNAVHTHPAFTLLLQQFGQLSQNVILSATEQPVLVVFISGCLYALMLLGWLLLLTVVTGLRNRITFMQRLALVVWSRWSMLVVMLLAVVADTLTGPVRRQTVLILAVVWLLSAFWSVLRMTSDCTRALGGRPLVAFGLSVGLPLVLTAVLVFLLVSGSDFPFVTYALHLAMRT